MSVKKRHLRDLFVRGIVKTIDDGQGGVTVYLKKLNLSENEQAVRKANAERAKVLAAAMDETSDLYQGVLGDAIEADRDTLLDYLIAEPLMRKRESIEAELSTQDQWAKDSYLQGLTDAWLNGLRDKFQEDPEDEDAKRVFDALTVYSNQIEELVEGESAALKRDYDDISDDELRTKVVKLLLKNRAELVWVDCYRKAELLYGVRDADAIHERYFETLEDVHGLETEVLLPLLKAYRELDVDPSEGKDSEETPTS